MYSDWAFGHTAGWGRQWAHIEKSPPPTCGQGFSWPDDWAMSEHRNETEEEDPETFASIAPGNQLIHDALRNSHHGISHEAQQHFFIAHFTA